MKQFDLFECQKELDIQAKWEQMFQKWRLLPPERLILAGTPDRRRLGEELADGYTSYTGAPEGVRASVKFVMKVEGPKAPAGGADDGRQAARAEAQPAEKPGFWQRVKNLFR